MMVDGGFERVADIEKVFFTGEKGILTITKELGKLINISKSLEYNTKQMFVDKREEKLIETEKQLKENRQNINSELKNNQENKQNIKDIGIQSENIKENSKIEKGEDNQKEIIQNTDKTHVEAEKAKNEKSSGIKSIGFR